MADTKRFTIAGAATSNQSDSAIPEFADETIALRFTDTFHSILRYVAPLAKWFEWDGRRWIADSTLHTFSRARYICRAVSAECDKDNVACKIASASTVAAVEKLARSDRCHAATVDQWDTDLWLLNTPGGTIDLRTADLNPHRAADYITKITAVAPGGACDIWTKFLHRVTNGDRDLEAYLQRVAGYILTGITREHALFFAYGTGANGKSVFINTLAAVMGDYARVASIETFTFSQTDRHPADLAMLHGARLVVAQETEEGRRWAESKMKSMTGGDVISARFMRQDFFSFTPTFKLLIAGNHRPGLQNADEAMRRRLNLIPFAVQIPSSERDQGLSEKLKDEWPGILSWMIQGCLEWQRIGLSPPPVVLKATDEYMAAEDTLAAWIAECCELSGSLHNSVGQMFASWSRWALSAGEPCRSVKWFSQAMQDRGFVSARLSCGKAGLRGIGLKG